MVYRHLKSIFPNVCRCTREDSPFTFSHQSDRKRAFRPGMFFHTDVSGPLQVASKGRHRCFITYKDDHNGYRFVFFLKDCKQILNTFKSMCETGHAMVRLRSDNSRECLSKAFQEYLRIKGIHHDVTTPYSLEQNAMAERDNMTLVECAIGSAKHIK